MSASSSGTHVWLVLMKAHRSLARHAARSIESAGVCWSDFAILELLLHKGPRPVNAIGKTIELTSGSITTAIDRLEGRGLVRRQNDPGDKRARIVSLTAEGRREIEVLFERHREEMDGVASGLTRAERTELVRLLKKLGLTADDHAAR